MLQCMVGDPPKDGLTSWPPTLIRMRLEADNYVSAAWTGSSQRAFRGTGTGMGGA